VDPLLPAKRVLLEQNAEVTRSFLFLAHAIRRKRLRHVHEGRTFRGGHRCRLERIGPAALDLDSLIDLGHDADGLIQSDNDLLVVRNIIGGEPAILPVFEPFVADLVSADAEVPDLLGHAPKASGAGLDRSVPLTGDGLGGVEPDGATPPAYAASLLRTRSLSSRDSPTGLATWILTCRSTTLILVNCATHSYVFAGCQPRERVP